jgi:hypothetical protein
MPQPYIPPDNRAQIYVVGDLRTCEFINATCSACGHQADIRLEPIVDRHGPWYPLGQIAKRLCCSRCGGRAVFPPRITSGVKPGRAIGTLTYHQWHKMLRGKRRHLNEHVSRMSGG